MHPWEPRERGNHLELLVNPEERNRLRPPGHDGGGGGREDRQNHGEGGSPSAGGQDPAGVGVEDPVGEAGDGCCAEGCAKDRDEESLGDQEPTECGWGPPGRQQCANSASAFLGFGGRDMVDTDRGQDRCQHGGGNVRTLDLDGDRVSEDGADGPVVELGLHRADERDDRGGRGRSEQGLLRPARGRWSPSAGRATRRR